MHQKYPRTIKLEADLVAALAPHVQILLVTAADAEAAAVWETLQPLPFLTNENGEPRIGTHYETFDYEIGVLGGYLAAHVFLIRQGDRMLPFTMEAATRTWPAVKFVAMPGMAFGLHSCEHDDMTIENGGQNMGDILVAESVLNVTHKNPVPTLIGEYLIQTLRRRTPRFEEAAGCAVHIGPMLTVPEVIRTRQERAPIRKRFGFHKNGAINAIGGEMESAALLNAQQFYTLCPARNQLYILLAKGISDWGIGKYPPGHPKRAEQEKDRVRASQNSLAYLVYMFDKESLPTEVFAIPKLDPDWKPEPPPAPGSAVVRSLRVQLGEKETVTEQEIAAGIVREGEGYANGGKDSLHYWRERFASDMVRYLIINGPSGRGKTFFAKQLRYWLGKDNPQSRHAWLDCTAHPPSAYTLWKLLRQLVPEKEQAKFDAVFPQTTEENESGAEFAETSAVTAHLRASLLAPDAPPLFLYLDDFDRYADALSDTKQAMTSFLTAFGEGPSCLRIIATSRDNRLDDQLKKTLSSVARLIDETGDALSPFSDADTRKYIETRGGILANLEAEEADRLQQLVQGDPLTLDLIEDELGGEASEANRQWLLSLLEHGEDENAPPETRRNFLRGLVFEKQMARVSKEAQAVAQALAVVADLEFNPFILLRREDSEDLILKLLGETVRDVEAGSIPTLLRELQDRGILKPNSCLFTIDSAQEYLFTAFLDAEQKPALHRRAQQAYTNANLPAFAIWHQIAAGDVDAGFDALSQATHRLQAQFRYTELRHLYRRLRQIYWKEEDWRWAVAQIKLAETLYIGFDITDAEPEQRWNDTLIPEQNEWELVRAALPKVEIYLSNRRLRPANPDHLHTLVDAYVHGRMMRAVCVFENPQGMIPDDDPLKKYTKPRDSLWLATEIKETLDVLSRYNVRLDPPLIANYTCLQGCFYNGGALLEEACAAFRQAEEALKAYETELTERGITLNPAQRRRLEQDRLDIANDWSRSRFLLLGPQAALDSDDPPGSRLAHFQQFLDTAERELMDTEEYIYSLIDICYYAHALGDWQLMREYLDLAYNTDVYSMPKPVEDKYKVALDHWTEGYVDALEIAYLFYTSDLSQSETAARIAAGFRACADRFGWEEFGYPRDEMMLDANALLVEMAAAGDFESRRVVMEKFEQSLTRSVQMDEDAFAEQSILDEPIVRDMLGYLQACFASENGQPTNDPDGAVARTRLRFPALLGEDCPTPLDADWKPPILLRGALYMRTNPCAPMPAELGISVW